MSLPSDIDCAGTTGGCGVLVVDDDRAVAEQLAGGLAMLGHAVDTVHSATAALALLASRPDIAVVVSDIRMAGRDGLELAQEILDRRPDDQAAEVVLITGHGTLETAAAAVRMRVSDFLTKPFRLADVGSAVDRALLRAQARRAEAAARAAQQAREASKGATAAGGIAPVALRSRDVHAVSHALRTPLNAIAGSAELIGARLGGGSADEPLRILRDGVARSVQAVELVEELHLLAEDRGPGGAGLRGPVRPGPLVAGAIARASEAAGAAGVALSHRAQDAAPFDGEAARIARTLDLCLGAMLESSRPGNLIEIGATQAEAAGRCWALLTLVMHPAGALSAAALPAGTELPQTGSPMTRTQETLGFAVARRIAESLGGRLTSANVSGGIVAIRLVLPA